jgi:hypothetical protein
MTTCALALWERNAAVTPMTQTTGFAIDSIFSGSFAERLCTLIPRAAQLHLRNQHPLECR